MVLTGGVHLSVERERGEREGGAGLRPAGLLLGLGPRVRPSWAGALLFSFFVLILFHFLFSFSSKTFAFVTQMTSNQFVKFSKIQNKQYKTVKDNFSE
jgi:hypothetical protein